MDGIILINKEKKCTSHDVVYKVKKIFREKVGHTGTLDPNATGVLPVLVGKGTKLSKYLINHDKAYMVTLKLGEKRDTADSEGNIVEKKDVPDEALKKENIVNSFKKFTGKIMQTPPIYSAIKVNGKKLYEYARKGEKIEIKPREIEIYNIDLKNVDIVNKEIFFEVQCSKGTYIRSLCEDIAQCLNTVGYMKELERIKVGSFNIKNSVKINELQENMENNDFLEENFITLEKFFEQYDCIEISKELLEKFLNGVKLRVNKSNGIYRVICDNKLIGTAILENCEIKRDIIV